MVKALLFSFVIVSFTFTSFGQNAELQGRFEKLLKKSDTSSMVYIDRERGYWEVKNTLPGGMQVGFKIPYKDMDFRYSRKSIGKKKSHYVKMSCPNNIPCFMSSDGEARGPSGCWQEFKSKVDAYKFLELMAELKQQ